MYENLNFDTVLSRLLSRIEKKYDVDPATPLYIALAPVAAELAEYIFPEWDRMFKNFYPISSEREFLIKDAATWNMKPYEATASIVLGEFDKPCREGDRFSKDEVNFRVVEPFEMEGDFFYYTLECETVGFSGNVSSGKLLPLSNSNIKHALLLRTLIPGEDEEDTEDFRERFLSSFKYKRYGWNLADAIDAFMDIAGVGRVKVLRCMDFEGNRKPEWVSFVFTDAENNKPTEELVKQAQEEIQPLVNALPELETSGLGKACIGSLNFVKGAEEEIIDITLDLTFRAGSTWENTENEIRKVIETYFNEEKAKWGDKTVTESAEYPMETFILISRAELESRIMDIEGVIDSNGVLINGLNKSYSCKWDAIPVLSNLIEGDTTYEDEEGDCPYNCPDCHCSGHMERCNRL